MSTITNANVYGTHSHQGRAIARIHQDHLMKADSLPGGYQPSDQANQLVCECSPLVKAVAICLHHHHLLGRITCMKIYSMVCVSAICVCWADGWTMQKTVEPIEMSPRGLPHVDPRNHALDRRSDAPSPWAGTYLIHWGKCMISW